MSDSLIVENGSSRCFDVEAQQSLLHDDQSCTTTTTTTTLPEADSTNFMSVLLVLRSVQVFKRALFDPPNYITSSTSSSSILSPAHHALLTHHHHHQDSGTVSAALDIPADPTDEDILLSSHDSASDEHQNNVDLQQIQRNNITEIVKNKDLQGLHDIGGVRGAAEALNTDLQNGISSRQDITARKPSQLCQVLVTFFHSFLGACNNYTVFLLSSAAFLSLGFGIKEEGLNTGWYNGGILLFCVFVLVILTTIHKCWESISTKKLECSWQSRGKKIQVKVVREGLSQFVHEIDLRVGDVAVLRRGDRVPADGLYITGQALELEGSIKSTAIDEQNPFLFYGRRVVNGDGRMLVTSTGMDTAWGEMMSQAMQYADNKCKFETYLHKLNNCVHISGLLISILIIIVLFLRYIAGKLDDERRFRPDTKGEPTPMRTIVDVFKGIVTGSRGSVRVLTTLLSLSLLGVMEGMTFVIAVAAIIWSRRTLAHRATERDYQAFLKMACVTTICTDEFGGLTKHEQEIDKFYVGEEFISESSVVSSNVLEGLSDGIGTLFLINPSACESEFVTLMLWAEAKLGMKRESVIQQCEMIEHSGCNPLQECCQVLIVKNGNQYLHCKGPPQDLLSSCSYHYDIDGQIRELDEIKRRMLAQAIGYMEAEAGKVIAYACKCTTESDQASVEPNNLILLALISLKETREDTRRAILTLMEGGITTILASGDDIAVLRTIGEDCGLLTPNSEDLVLTAEEFRGWTEEEKMDKVEKIRIMGNCLSSDKILLIKCLQENDQVVALLAQQTIDAPALKQANIGLTYGTWSSEIARKCCDISIWDSNCFGFLVNVIENGRCFQENIRKFIQLELIITISSSLINFTATVILGDAPITAVQLFWLNLVVAFAGGLAVLTGPPTKMLMTRLLPVTSSATARLISKAMWRNIAVQASYQTTIFVTLQHKGHIILGTSGGHLKSLIYNGLFLCQMFNKFIAREPEKKNIFSGLFQYYNRWFWVAVVVFLVCQAVFAMAETVLGSSPRLNMKLWGVCILVGLVSWVLDWAGKSLSNFAAKRAAANDSTDL
ncbi:UNVERIFIED_CONTAM: putative calcium-transporting ATPase 13, plasma membrane-type [Sesamum radiatum]|uniref:Calcium-transporting ATPase 13, plasma membrane-type n=1 Tax=Sesamum radiatum TaxID=300843 RepID=A0AAW2T3B0_SESRA